MRYTVTQLQTSTVEISDEVLIAWATESLELSSTAPGGPVSALQALLKSNAHFREAMVASYLAQQSGAAPVSVHPRPE